MAKKPDVTEKCPQCHGDGTVQGRYTDGAPLVCPTCGGDGHVPKGTEVADAEPEAEGAEAE